MEIKVTKYILSEHPKKGDVLNGGKANGYKVEKIIAKTKQMPFEGLTRYYYLYLSNEQKGLKRIAAYYPKQKKIGDFQQGFLTATKGTYYLTWN
jgi:hypothetical protein